MNGLDMMKKRLSDTKIDGRINNIASRSLNYALSRSHQAEDIVFNGKPARCLINPDKLTNDYDQKIIDIDFSYGMAAGDTFYWPRTNSYWISYLQDFSHEAYYHARIRRCDYSIEVNGNKYWVYLRGPVETAILDRQKHQIEFNELNYSLIMYVTKNGETNEFFQRYQMIKFDNHNWRVDTVDRYSTPGILEVNLLEHFDNKFEDIMKEEEKEKQKEEVIVNTLPHIIVPKDIYCFDTDIKFCVAGIDKNGTFSIDDKTKAIITSQDNGECYVNIKMSKSGSFTLYYKIPKQESLSTEVYVKSI